MLSLGIFAVSLRFSHAKIVSPLGSVLASLQKPKTQEEQVVSGLISRHIAYTSIAIKGDTIAIVLQDGIQVILASQKDISKQLTSLQLAMTDLTIEKRKPIKIDFRFDRVVYSF